MKSVKYVERNQKFHSDVKQMRPNQEVDQKYLQMLNKKKMKTLE